MWQSTTTERTICTAAAGDAPSARDLDAPRLDVQGAVTPRARPADRALQDGRPHVELDLLGHAQLVVHHVRERVAGARPGFDLEDDYAVLVTGAPFDLPGLDVAGERHEAKRRRRQVDHADRAVPGARHPH